MFDSKCKLCESKKFKVYIPHWKDGSFSKCSISLCEEHLKFLQKKHPEIAYVWWTKERENNGSYKNDVEKMIHEL